MIRWWVFLTFAVVIIGCKSEAPTSSSSSNEIDRIITIEYPNLLKSKKTNTFFNKEIENPFEWLENDDNDTVKQWISEQKEITEGYLSNISYRKKIEKRFNEIIPTLEYGVPEVVNGFYFLTINNKKDGTRYLYRQKKWDAEKETILGSAALGDNTLGKYAFSDDGKYVAYTVSTKNGWGYIGVKDMESDKILTDKLSVVYNSNIAWSGKGFYYSRYLTEEAIFQEVYYHKLGDNPSKDELIFSDKANARHIFDVQLTSDKRFLVLYAKEQKNGNALYFKDLNKRKVYFEAVSKSFDADFKVIDAVGDDLLVYTNYKAPNYRLVLVNTNQLEEVYWEDIIVENGEKLLKEVSIIGDKIIAQYIMDFSSEVVVYSKEGKYIDELLVEKFTSITGISGNQNSKYGFLKFSSFLEQGVIYQYDAELNEFKPILKPHSIGINPDDYQTSLIYCGSSGEKIPILITCKKELKKDGKNPLLLTGVGSFNEIVKMKYNPMIIPFLENGGIYAIAAIRGGGDKGTEWHRAGRKRTKKTTFEDFIKVGDYMSDENYTSSDRLALMGDAAESLLVGVVMTKRPELFKVAITSNGLFDMLNYHKFKNGYLMENEFGTSKDSITFNYLLEYSPLHNIKKGINYPPLLLSVDVLNQYISPVHSYKLGATLQQTNLMKSPILLNIVANNQNSNIFNTTQATAELSFLFYHLNMKMD